MKRAASDHPKLQRLQRRLSLKRYQAMGLMEALWHFTGRYSPEGDIGRWSDEEIAAWVEWDGEPEELVGTLVTCGWLDEHPVFRLVVHDWAEHADEATKVSLKRAGKAFVVATNTDSKATPLKLVATVSRPPEPEPEPCHAMPPPGSTNDAETEITSMASEDAASEPVPPAGKPKRSGPTPAEISEAWLAFDAVYPVRTGDRGLARGREKFAALLKSGVPPGDIIDGARRYLEWAKATGQQGSPYVKQIPTFLNGRSWQESWAIPKDTGNGHPQRQQNGRHDPASNTVAATTERVLREIAERRGAIG